MQSKDGTTHTLFLAKLEFGHGKEWSAAHEHQGFHGGQCLSELECGHKDIWRGWPKSTNDGALTHMFVHWYSSLDKVTQKYTKISLQFQHKDVKRIDKANIKY